MSERELATVLAALRFWQRHLEQGNLDGDDEFMPIATDEGEFNELSAGEIDDLCMRLNT